MPYNKLPHMIFYIFTYIAVFKKSREVLVSLGELHKFKIRVCHSINKCNVEKMPNYRI